MAVKEMVLTKNEIDHRAGVLRRFRELLKDQRDRFRTYLDVLDKQKISIENGNADDLIRHVELEEKIVNDIFSIQKVIDPMEDMYQAVLQDKTGQKDQNNSEVIDIKAALEGLKTEAISRSDRNRNLLSKRMAELRSEIKSLRSNPYSRQRSVYSGQGVPSVVDMMG